MSPKNLTDRYKYENKYLIVEVGVKNSRQLFNERDPAPFRERDLDPQFVIYIISAVEEFSLQTKMKIRILTLDKNDTTIENTKAIGDAIRTYFGYESILMVAQLRKRLRTARLFFMIGLVTLVVCMSLASLLESVTVAFGLTHFLSVSFIIIGWVAMWHPVEALLYDWWPIREQRQYLDKMAQIDVEVVERAANV